VHLLQTAGRHFILVAPLPPPHTSISDQYQSCNCITTTCAIISPFLVNGWARWMQLPSCCDCEMKKRPGEVGRAVHSAFHHARPQDIRHHRLRFVSFTQTSTNNTDILHGEKDWLAASPAGGRYFWVTRPGSRPTKHRQSWRPPEDEPVMSM
jgi:hypothetical protein